MAVHYPANIGYTAIVRGVRNRFNEAMAENKVYVIPRAKSFRGYTRTVVERNGNGNSFEMHGGWYLNNPSTCAPDMENYDPWACSYISLSHCTRRESGVLLSSWPENSRDEDKYPKLDFHFYEKFFHQPYGQDTKAVISAVDRAMTMSELRQRYVDLPLLSDLAWSSAITGAFVQVG
jgi:hypothetical protein